MDLLKNLKVTTALDYASGTAARNGATLDMKGYEGVLMICKCATIAAGAVGDLHAEQGAESDLSDAADLLGTAIAIAADDDNQIFIIDLYRPRERYVRAVVTKDAANAQAEDAIYIQYGAKKMPIDNNVADEVTVETHISPAEGTK